MIPSAISKRLNQLGGFSLVLAVAFSLPLFRLGQFALHDDLFSYILIIPVVCGWLVWQDRQRLSWEFVPAPGASLTLTIVGAGLSGLALMMTSPEHATARLSLSILGFVALLNAGSFWFLGRAVMRQIAFPAAFLMFMAPLPPGLVHSIEIGLQHASAEASAWLFSLTGAAYFRNGLVFQLPGITLEVAPECSGIRSTLVLFMTSLIAGHLFLERGWQRWVFTLLVIPLGIARNALRIVTIGWLCIEYGPEMIHSAIHRRGGPFFFALSLVPLFALLWLFRRLNNKRAASDVTRVMPPPKPMEAGS